MKNKKLTKKHSYKLQLSNLTIHDLELVHNLSAEVYTNLGGPWSHDDLLRLVEKFPEGQIIIKDGSAVIAVALSLMINYPALGDEHTYDDVIDGGRFSSHTSFGDTLYGIDIFVHPHYRGLRLGRRLYDARKELCQKLNIRRHIVGGRIPSYHKVKDRYSPIEYIEQVKQHHHHDLVLSFQINNGFHVRKLLTNYLPDDQESCGYAVLLEWVNLAYSLPKPIIGSIKTACRVGAVQWQMRSLTRVEELLTHAEFFIDALSGYHCDFALFPEYFSAPLMANFNHLSPHDAMRRLAGFTPALCDGFQTLAMSHNINIIAGSMPYLQEQQLFNCSWIFRRDGTQDIQYKLHVTPDEHSVWGIQGGTKLRILETDCGKVAILICFDCEFPELARLAALEGAKIIFVPFWTDTKNAFLRVKCCAQARAIENEAYVVIAGSVGNLPNVENMDIQYAQSAIFSPSDFLFPHDAIIAEATPNTEMTLIADLDLKKIDSVRLEGAVKNLLSRRTELYKLAFV